MSSSRSCSSWLIGGAGLEVLLRSRAAVTGRAPGSLLIGPGDLAAQARQVFANLGRALAPVGAGLGEVAKITIYVVHHQPEYLPMIQEARAGLFGDHKPADTLVGVQTLAGSEYPIEVHAIAVISD